MSDIEIRKLCVSILCDYQHIEEHYAWEYVNKMPLFFPSACAADKVLNAHENT